MYTHHFLYLWWCVETMCCDDVWIFTHVSRWKELKSLIWSFCAGERSENSLILTSLQIHEFYDTFEQLFHEVWVYRIMLRSTSRIKIKQASVTVKFHLTIINLILWLVRLSHETELNLYSRGTSEDPAIVKSHCAHDRWSLVSQLCGEIILVLSACWVLQCKDSADTLFNQDGVEYLKWISNRMEASPLEGAKQWHVATGQENLFYPCILLSTSTCNIL